MQNHFIEVETLERNLMEDMIRLLVRCPDGLKRIEHCLESVKMAGEELTGDLAAEFDTVKH